MFDKRKYKAFFLGFCGGDWSIMSGSWVSVATEFGIDPGVLILVIAMVSPCA
jgi:hypothetical protein